MFLKYIKKTRRNSGLFYVQKYKWKGEIQMLKGIDVSEHQGTIDWNQVKGNIDFAILRAGYGITI